MAIDYWSALGFTNNAWMFMEAFAGSPAIIKTDNPNITLEEFHDYFPVFDIGDEEGQIPTAVYNLFYAMADKCIKYDRYRMQWPYLMGLYIAHFLTLYLQTQAGDPGSASALQGAMPTGVASSKSVDGLSISYDFMGLSEDLAGYGTWKLTKYGQQLATLTKVYGHSGMWVNF